MPTPPRSREQSPLIRASFPAIAACLLLGCQEPGTTEGSDRVGDLSRRDYGQATPVERVTASGLRRVWSDYAGEFVWAEYAAPWCGTSPRQSSQLEAVSSHDGVRRVTVLTSEKGGYGHPATRETAAAWAARFRLDPDHVLAADLSYLTVPRHILFSPEGQTLLDHTGYLGSEEVSSILSERVADWLRWKTTGEPAIWMR